MFGYVLAKPIQVLDHSYKVRYFRVYSSTINITVFMLKGCIKGNIKTATKNLG